MKRENEENEEYEGNETNETNAEKPDKTHKLLLHIITPISSYRINFMLSTYIMYKHIWDVTMPYACMFLSMYMKAIIFKMFW